MQDYDPGYPVPDLSIGHVIAGHKIIAAIREHDRPGLLPGLHIVLAETDHDMPTPLVTWEVGYQRDYNGGQYVANAGHYFGADQYADAVADMVRRASSHPA
jgi:hypothetical protein